MSKRPVRTMLRDMASGEPVQVTSANASAKKLARLAAIAQQFGYEYADIRQGGGVQGNGLVMLIVPDLSPQARERAARNRARYPDASDGVAPIPLDPDAVALLKTRIAFDLSTTYTEKQRVTIGIIGLTVMAVVIGFKAAAHPTALLVIGIVWAVLMALMPVAFIANRRYRAKYAARLEAAGFTRVTDQGGRPRYVPPGGQLPGHGNPFAAGGA